MSAYNKEQLDLLKQFVSLCKANPKVLNLPELGFFKSWIESLGGKIPAPAPAPEPTSEGSASSSGSSSQNQSSKQDKTPPPPPPPKAQAFSDESSESEEEKESDIELDNTGVIEGDNEPPQEMGDPNVEVSESDSDLADEKRSEAQSQMSDGNFEKAIELFTEAIKKNPHLAVLFAKRANAYIKLKKPNAAVRDCNRALEINPNSQQALKWRGYAYKLLGKWEEAHIDLCAAQKNDYDEDVAQWIKEVTPNANKVKEHKRKQERKREEKLIKQREKARKKAQKEYDRQKAEKPSTHDIPRGGAGAGAGGFGGMPGMGDLGGLLNDPELLKEFQDPEVAQAFTEISSNPANILKYQNNPKVKKIIDKLASKFGGGGAGGFPGGGFPGGGFPGGGFPGGGFPGGGFPGGFPGAGGSEPFDFEPE